MNIASNLPHIFQMCRKLFKSGLIKIKSYYLNLMPLLHIAINQKNSESVKLSIFNSDRMDI